MIYTNKEEEDGKKKINGLDRSLRWSEDLSFRANHIYILGGNTFKKCLLSAMATMDDYVSSHFMSSKGACY